MITLSEAIGLLGRWSPAGRRLFPRKSRETIRPDADLTSMNLVLIVLIILILAGGGGGYYYGGPQVGGGIGGLLLVILIIWVIFGRRR